MITYKKIISKCPNCHHLEMYKLAVDYDKIRQDENEAYIKGYNEGYEKASKEFADKIISLFELKEMERM